MIETPVFKSGSPFTKEGPKYKHLKLKNFENVNRYHFKRERAHRGQQSISVASDIKYTAYFSISRIWDTRHNKLKSWKKTYDIHQCNQDGRYLSNNSSTYVILSSSRVAPIISLMEGFSASSMPWKSKSQFTSASCQDISRTRVIFKCMAISLHPYCNLHTEIPTKIYKGKLVKGNTIEKKINLRN